MRTDRHRTKAFPLLSIAPEILDELVRRAELAFLGDEQEWFAALHGFPGTWATGPTEDQAREELASVLHEWISLAVHRDQPLPEIEGVDLRASVGT